MSIFLNIKNWFNILVSGLWGFMKSIIKGAAEIALAQIKDIAVNAVSELENSDMSNEEKRSAAFSNIKTYALNKKITITDSLINLAIELAVQFIKSKIK